MFISTLESKARSDKVTCSRSHRWVTRELQLQPKTLCFTSIIVGVTFNVCSQLKQYEILLFRGVSQSHCLHTQLESVHFSASLFTIALGQTPKLPSSLAQNCRNFLGSLLMDACLSLFPLYTFKVCIRACHSPASTPLVVS